MTAYVPTTVSLVGQPDAELLLRLDDSAAHASVSGHTIIVEPHPDADRLACLLFVDNASVEVVLDLPRVWWRLEIEDGPTKDWQATPFVVTRPRFRQLAMSNASVSFRLPTRARSIAVGLNTDIDRAYRKGSPDHLVRIPLIDFSDYEQLDGRPHDQLTMSARLGDAVIAFLVVTADPLPAILSFRADPSELLVGQPATLRWTTRNAHESGVTIEPDVGGVGADGTRTVTPRVTSTYTLRVGVIGRKNVTASTTVFVLPGASCGQTRPRVKCLRGWRAGKGFSRGELQLAGLDTAYATKHGLRVDRRRRTTHRQNAMIIQEKNNAR